MASHAMSRVQRRSGTKSLTCGQCGNGKNGKAKMKFRGRGRARLQKHLVDVHGR